LTDSGIAAAFEKGSSEGYPGKERGGDTDFGNWENRGDTGLA